MQKLIGAIFLVFSVAIPAAHAAEVTFAESAHQKYNHIFLGGIGFVPAGASLNLEYEHPIQRTYSFGGYLDIYPKNDLHAGFTTLGAFLRPHLFVRNWDVYISGGFGLIMVSGTGKIDSKTTFGPNMAIGLLYQISDTIAVGMQNVRHYIWFDPDTRGIILDVMSIQAKIGF